MTTSSGSSVQLAHDLTGPAGAPVVALAGSLGSTRAMWDPQVDALAGSYRVLRLDHRGHGGSPVPDGPYAVADLVDDVLGLLDRLELSRVAFCGLSLGGMVGIRLAAVAPERVSKLVLCSTTAHFADPGPWQQRARLVREHGTSILAEAVAGRWFTTDWANAHPDRVAAYRSMILETPDEGYAGCCEAIAAWDGRGLLERITAPTLVLAGGQDEATPPEHAETIARGIGPARLEVLDDAAHLASVQAAERVTSLLAEHVGEG